MNQIDITERFENSKGRFWAEFRNGFTDKVTGVRFWDSNHSGNSGTFIDIINSRGDVLRGGAYVPTEALLNLCEQFLREHGYTVTRNLTLDEQIEAARQAVQELQALEMDPDFTPLDHHE